jgi:hypothetical protein
LEREVARLARKSLRKILEGKEKSVTITPENLADFAGVRKFRHGVSDEENQIGAVTGLAWTEVGGELLTIESVTVPGKGAVKTTGKLGEVMSESVQMAFSFVKARAPAYGIKPSIFNRKDLHIHLPEGAVPKDGPSAGIGMVTAMVSTLTGIPVRADVAMTGEVTLRGRVLAIGGLKEKLLAALRGGIKTVLIPEENARIWPRSRPISAKVWRSCRSAMSIRFWPARWPRRRRSNGPRPTIWPASPARPRRVARRLLLRLHTDNCCNAATRMCHPGRGMRVMCDGMISISLRRKSPYSRG